MARQRFRDWNMWLVDDPEYVGSRHGDEDVNYLVLEEDEVALQPATHAPCSPCTL